MKRHVRLASKSILAVALSLCLIVSGCNAQQWFDIVASLLPIIGQTYLQFYGFAQGGAPDAGDVARVQTLTTAGQEAIHQIEALVAAYKTSQDPSKLGEAKAILAQLQKSVDAFLTDAQIKNSTRFDQYRNFAQAILADVTDVIALIPVLIPAAAGGRTTVTKMPTSYRHAQSLKAVFQERLDKLK